MGLPHPRQLPDAQLWPHRDHSRLLLFSASPTEPAPPAPRSGLAAYLTVRLTLASPSRAIRPLHLYQASVFTAVVMALLIATAAPWFSVLPVFTALFALVAAASALHALRRPLRHVVVEPASPLAALLDLAPWPTVLSPSPARTHLLSALWWTSASANPPAGPGDFYAGDRYACHPTSPLPDLTPATTEIALALWDPDSSGPLSTLPGALATAALLPTP
jgi:hypothetical protein